MQSRRRGPLRFVHTSDVHLDDDQPAPARAFAGLIDAAVELAVDLLIVAGDLFDHNRVSDDLVARFLDESARLSAPVVVLPGNHDCYAAGSVYRRPAFGRAAHVSVLSGRPLDLPPLGLRLWGSPVVEHSPSFRPLGAVPPHEAEGWYVVVAHGHLELQRPGPGEPHRSSPIAPEEIAAAACDFVALGHWDRFADVSCRGVVAAYAGPPGQGANLVELAPGSRPRLLRLPLRP